MILPHVSRVKRNEIHEAEKNKWNIYMTKITKVFCLAQLADTNPDLYVCDDPPIRECSNCKKKYVPTNEDISTRRPSTYWRQCGDCREYMQKRNKKCVEKT